MATTTTSEKQNRRIQRISMSLPIKVVCQVDKETSWDEVTRLLDVSTFGAGFTLSRPVKRGRLVALTMPLPRRLRIYDYTEPEYNIWGIVRRCIKTDSPFSKGISYSIGVAFIGKNPPQEFVDDPSNFFDITDREEKGLWNIELADENPDESDLPPEQRRHSRYMLPTNIIAEMIDKDGNVIKSEQTVTENLSLSGASIFSMLDVEVGAFVRITSELYNTTIISIVRGKRIGEDGIPRLHVEFVDHFFPLEGIETNPN
jgi:hypothetical protein